MIDIEKIKQAALDAVDELDDCARMETSIYAIGAVSHLTHFINTVCERLEAAEKDAARYQWLKDSASNWIKADVEIDTFMNSPYNLSYQQALDEVVDAAIKESE